MPVHRNSLPRVMIGGVFSSIVITLGACQSGSMADANAPMYPEEKTQGTTLDIQVVRDDTSISLTNTTSRAFGRSRLWINRWFSRDIEQFDVGQTLTFDLTEFRDQYGEAFQAGGFFATKKPDPVVLAQLETADSMVGLVVVNNSAD